MPKKKKAVKPALPQVQYVEGNGEKLSVLLLDKIARKLDNIDNNIVAQNDMLMEILEKVNDG